MKTLIPILMGLLVVGCGKAKTETKTETQSPEEKLVGSYEKPSPIGMERKLVLLENGKVETYKNGEKRLDGTWKISGKEVHVDAEENSTWVFKIEPNGDLTFIAETRGGKRDDASKDEQETLKKINSQTAKETPKETPPKTKVTEDNNTKPIKVDDNATKPVKELTLEEKFVGEYEFKVSTVTGRLIFMDGGFAESYTNGKKEEKDAKWKIVDGELHVVDKDKSILVYRINKDGSITFIGGIAPDGERDEVPKEFHTTYKKIK